jgi:hypothetical protein
MLSRYQNAAAASREYYRAISGKTPSWARLVIIKYSEEMDRTGLKILENNKNIQSIISVNTNILLRRFRLKFLRIMCSIRVTRNASTYKTPCIIRSENIDNEKQ